MSPSSCPYWGVEPHLISLLCSQSQYLAFSASSFMDFFKLDSIIPAVRVSLIVDFPTEALLLSSTGWMVAVQPRYLLSLPGQSSWVVWACALLALHPSKLNGEDFLGCCGPQHSYFLNQVCLSTPVFCLSSPGLMNGVFGWGGFRELFVQTVHLSSCSVIFLSTWLCCILRRPCVRAMLHPDRIN